MRQRLTQALTGRLTPETMLTAIGVAILLSLAARLFWNFGVKHYAGASA